MKIIKTIFSGFLVIAACAAVGIAQGTAGDKGAPTSARTTSDSANLPKGWQNYDLGAKDTFKIALPSKPEVESKDLRSGNYNMKVTYFTSSSSEIVTVLADIYDLPINSDSLSEKNKLSLFEKVREGLTQGIKSELEKNGLKTDVKFHAQKNVTLKGIGGYEQDVSVGNFKGKARMLSNKDHIYIFFTLILDESKETLMGDFLDSFEYTGAK